MALSRAEIEKVDALTRQKIADFNTRVAESEKVLSVLHTELQTFTDVTAAQIAQQTDMWMKFVFHEGPMPKLNLVEIRNKFDNLNTRIANRRDEFSVLRASRTEFYNTLVPELRTKIIDALQTAAFVKALECPICFKVKPPVKLRFPCHVSRNDTGRPTCWKSVCLTCARQVTGLSPSVNRPTTVKCPWCPTTCPRFPNGSAAYELNMSWMAYVDDCLAEEDLVFRSFFGIPLNPISCPECLDTFSGMSDLHHHMRGDTGFTACPESIVKCRTCVNSFARRLLSVRGQCSRCSTVGPGSNTDSTSDWNAPAPGAADAQW
jgi:hypothetical protein